jgi:hypothetical protein
VRSSSFWQQLETFDMCQTQRGKITAIQRENRRDFKAFGDGGNRRVYLVQACIGVFFENIRSAEKVFGIQLNNRVFQSRQLANKFDKSFLANLLL